MAEYKVTFAYIKGMWYSFPSVESARQAITKYTGNMDSLTYTKPRGVAINTSLGWSTDGEFADMANWPDQVFAPEGVTGDALWSPPNNPITVETTIPPDDSGDETGYETKPIGDEKEIIEEVDLLDWSAQDEDLVNLAKRYATAGMMGRAQAAFVKSGGTWSDAVHLALKEGAKDKTYGGTIKFDWANLGVDATMLETIKDLAKKGQYGRISKLMEDEDGKTTFNKDVHQKLQAFVHMGDREWDPAKGQVKEEVEVEEHVYDPAKMKGTREEIKNKFKTGQARLDAQTWRKNQMAAFKKKFNVGGEGHTQAESDAWKKKQRDIANRHRVMIGAGKKTLADGTVIGEDV